MNNITPAPRLRSIAPTPAQPVQATQAQDFAQTISCGNGRPRVSNSTPYNSIRFTEPLVSVPNYIDHVTLEFCTSPYLFADCFVLRLQPRVRVHGHQMEEMHLVHCLLNALQVLRCQFLNQAVFLSFL